MLSKNPLINERTTIAMAERMGIEVVSKESINLERLSKRAEDVAGKEMIIDL